MKCKRWDATLLGVVAMALALACESSAPIAAPSTSRADALSASAAAPSDRCSDRVGDLWFGVGDSGRRA